MPAESRRGSVPWRCGILALLVTESVQLTWNGVLAVRARAREGQAMLSARNQSVIGLTVLLLAAGGCSQQATTENVAGAANEAASETHSGMLEGVVTDSAGKPLTGAFVKLRNETGRLTFMVVSRDGGHFFADKLPPGSYSVQGVGGDFESDWSAPVRVSNASTAQTDVTLALNRAPNLPPAWPRRIPEDEASMDDLPDHPAKQLITTACTVCHTEWLVVTSRYDRGTWEGSIEEMREYMTGVGMSDLTDEDADMLVDYLVENLPPLDPPNPNSRFPRDFVQGEARNYRVVQYDLENLGAETHDVAVDPWGIGWANQRIGGKISRFDPVTYEYSEVGPPLYTATRARPGNLQISREGIMWLADPFETRWLSYDIAADDWTDWPFPTDEIRGQVQGNSLTLHPDGTIWMAGPGSARRLNPATAEWSTWDTPTWNDTQLNPGGYGITYDGNGRVWMAENIVDKMARFDGETGEVVEFDIPSDVVAYPRRMDHDPSGDVWVGLWSSGDILKIDHETDEMTLITPPIEGSGAYSIDFDETNGYMWVTLHKTDIIARYNTETGEWLMFPLPQAETDVRRIEVDRNNPNRIWWCSTSNNARIGYIELL
jgi:streptogramin lyase